MKKIQIKNRFTDAVIYEGEFKSLRDAVIDAVANRANLSGANLSDANLSRAYLSYADLSGANLSRANLSRANLSRANLSDAYLSGADLSRANLSRANLSYADLSGANLSRANLSRANLSGANLSRAYLSGANLSDAYLSDANLSRATMPGFKDAEPQSLSEAAQKTKEWLLDGHWVQGKWIDTPDGAYSGTCMACLHGAAVYIGGKFGVELSRKLCDAGYDIAFNDAGGRTVEDIAKALDAVSEAQ